MTTFTHNYRQCYFVSNPNNNGHNWGRLSFYQHKNVLQLVKIERISLNIRTTILLIHDCSQIIHYVMSIHKCLPHHIHMTISHFTHPPTATLTSWQLLEVSASLVDLETRDLLCQDCSVLAIFYSHLRELEVRDAKQTTTCRWDRGSWDCQCNASLGVHYNS